MGLVRPATLVRWAIALGVVAVLLALWRLFLLVCPTRQWTVLVWSLEPRTAQAWHSPETAALVAENALENGGPVGQWWGRRLYASATVAPGAAPRPDGPQPYAQVHLDLAWLGTESITWSTEPFTGKSVLVKVFVQARLLRKVPYRRGCASMQPVMSLVERDYETVPTPAGWRVSYVYLPYGGNAEERPAPMGPGTAAAALAGCME